MNRSRSGFHVISFCLLLLLLSITIKAQQNASFKLTADSFNLNQPVIIEKTNWKFRTGDDLNWAARDFNDSDWASLEDTKIKPDQPSVQNWSGRAWFRLHIEADEAVLKRELSLLMILRGAAEVYLDGKLLTKLGDISDSRVTEYNPNRLPIPFQFDNPGEHTLAVRFASQTFADWTTPTAAWLVNGKVYPGFTSSITANEDLHQTIRSYANWASMRGGYFFAGVLFALALLHFLLFLFYRVERGNFFYSLYAAAFGIYIVCNNFLVFGHQPIVPSIFISMTASVMLALTFTNLLGFVYVAFERKLGKVFWAMAAAWTIYLAASAYFLNSLGNWRLLANGLIGLTFTFSFFQLVQALRDKRRGAWILICGVLILSLSMFGSLLNQLNMLYIPESIYFLIELPLILAIPVAVSIFLARNFARTNRDLKAQIEQVNQLSLQKIEHERQAAWLRAENERRAKELEEARALQFSMLPKSLPKIPNVEIAAFMKPATEVGGDYYDFHLADNGTLTVAVGDATGHGLKAGTMVTATKSLFNNLAHEPDIGNIFNQSSAALKKMNMRGMFMAMTMIKLKDHQLMIGCAGMPSALIYRAENTTVEEISIRAMPWGSPLPAVYQQHQLTVNTGDCILLMSDGFPEMFNENDEMLGFDEAKKLLSLNPARSAQEIIDDFVKAGEDWANSRAQDDDVTFVVLKIR